MIEPQTHAPAQPDRSGWNTPRPEVIPRPTAWPPAMALGVTLFGWGFVTSPVLLAVGAALFVLALVGWIAEIRHERRQA
jgi:hypothetical protein